MRIGTIGYATHQGLGYLAKSFVDAGVIDKVLVVPHSAFATQRDWYGDKATFLDRTPLPFPDEVLLPWLEGLDMLLCFETPFDWTVPDRCKRLGIRTVCMPMYEWYPREMVGVFDHYLCPSALDQKYFPGSPLFVPPVDPSVWKQRTSAKRFVHNAGHGGSLGRNGTHELIEAMRFVKSDLTLTIRCQDESLLDKILGHVPDADRFSNVWYRVGDAPKSDLYEDDVYVAPEKFNGLSLPLQEAYSSGMLVMTTRRFPQTTWLPDEPMIPVSHTRIISVRKGFMPVEAAVIDPKAIATMMDAWYDADITAYSDMGLTWAKANSWEARKPELMDTLEKML